MEPTRVATKPEQVVKNIKSFQSQVRSHGGDNELARTLSHFRAWYAVEDAGKWIFGPSKFVGYVNLSAETYAATAANLDGRRTEAALKPWFVQVLDGQRREELQEKLHAFLAEFGKQPSRAMRLSVLRDQETSPARDQGGDVADALLTLYRELPQNTRQEFRKRLAREL